MKRRNEWSPGLDHKKPCTRGALKRKLPTEFEIETLRKKHRSIAEPSSISVINILIEKLDLKNTLILKLEKELNQCKQIICNFMRQRTRCLLTNVE